MTALIPVLETHIARTGPLTIAEYMNLCLQHPQHGYYITRDPFGQAGDFTTAPEIHQIFGEMIGLWLAQVWMDQGCGAFTLAELGPGRGTLMADILRVGAKVPGFLAAAQVVLVETSPVLRAIQDATLAGTDVQWVETAADLPDGPLLLVANEFFDALPIRQYVRDNDLWRERIVGLHGGQLSFGLSEPAKLDHISALYPNTQSGQLVEHCAAFAPIMDVITNRLKAGGAALIIDYGDWASTGDSFQALQSQRPIDPLAAPGDSDLTAHVPFSHLAHEDLQSQFTQQGPFLDRLGVTPRAQVLAKQDKNVAIAHRRLTHPDEMGSLFKVLGLRCIGPVLPGF